MCDWNISTQQINLIKPFSKSILQLQRSNDFGKHLRLYRNILNNEFI